MIWLVYILSWSLYIILFALSVDLHNENSSLIRSSNFSLGRYIRFPLSSDHLSPNHAFLNSRGTLCLICYTFRIIFNSFLSSKYCTKQWKTQASSFQSALYLINVNWSFTFSFIILSAFCSWVKNTIAQNLVTSPTPTILKLITKKKTNSNTKLYIHD